MLCYTATTDKKQASTFDECELFVKAQTAAHSTTYIKVEAVASKSGKVQPTNDTQISNESTLLSYIKQDKGKSVFTLEHPEMGIKQDIAFSLQYYNPSTGNDGYADSDNVPSGAYIFKPKRGDMDKKPYCSFQRMETYKTEASGVEAFALYYANADSSKEYTVLIRTMPETMTLEWEVQLHGIPVSDYQGKEVVVNWDILDFASNNTFYTDSNGLEMQKRVLNERPDFTLVTDEFASSNYYPINSAIAIRGQNNIQVTLMNDRSQGGSVLEDGSIEFMQNRRLLHDDGRGVGEDLNETNESGYGIQVNTRYFLQVFDTTKTKSMQRETQLVVDEPLTYFSAKADSMELA